MSRFHRVILEDGDTLSIIVRLPPSLFDPANLIPAVGQRFRVVADVYAPTLALVPLLEKTSKLDDKELSNCEASQE